MFVYGRCDVLFNASLYHHQYLPPLDFYPGRGAKCHETELVAWSTPSLSGDYCDWDAKVWDGCVKGIPPAQPLYWLFGAG